MAEASVIHRETTSAVSISRPVVFSPRPYSSRVQSAQLLISKNTDLTRECITNGVFPDIQGLSISQKSGTSRAAHQVQKGSNFPNFRLLQRLAASAKARISSNSINSQRTLAIHEDEISTWDNHLLHSAEDDYTTEPANASFTSRTEQLLPQANQTTDKSETCGVRGSKSQRRQSKFKTKRRGKQLSHTKRRGGETAFSQLQPSTSKVIPTFSQRFTKRRRSNQKTSSKSESSDKPFGLQFSLTAYPQYSNNHRPADSNSDLLVSFRNSNGQNIDCSTIQEAKLRAIYNASQGPTIPATSEGQINKIRLKKVFQSEKQSGYMTQCGRLLPCAPPTSPTPLILDQYEIIPSLADLRSQQSIKQRLTALEKENKRKREAENQEKKCKERQILQMQFEAHRVRTRQEIYALNKIMTKLEKEHFKKFQEKMKNR